MLITVPLSCVILVIMIIGGIVALSAGNCLLMININSYFFNFPLAVYFSNKLQRAKTRDITDS